MTLSYVIFYITQFSNTASLEGGIITLPFLSPPEIRGHPSHSPLAFTLKVIDLLHLHPFDTYDQERRGRQDSPRLCSENSRTNPTSTPAWDRRSGVTGFLPKSSTRRVKRPGWDDKKRDLSFRCVRGPSGLPSPRPAEAPPYLGHSLAPASPYSSSRGAASQRHVQALLNPRRPQPGAPTALRAS